MSCKSMFNRRLSGAVVGGGLTFAVMACLGAGEAGAGFPAPPGMPGLPGGNVRITAGVPAPPPVNVRVSGVPSPPGVIVSERHAPPSGGWHKGGHKRKHGGRKVGQSHHHKKGKRG